MSFNQNLHSPFCLSCLSWFVQDSLFCKSCTEHLIQNKIGSSELFRNQEGAQHVYLMKWPQEDHQSMNQLVYRLKRNTSPEALIWYGERLVEKIRIQGFDCYDAIVPIASSGSSRQSHSEKLADVISNKLKIKKQSFFMKLDSQKTQKRLNREQRREHKLFNLNSSAYEEFTSQFSTEASKRHKFLFVDDILTSGASLRSCQSLLNCNYESDVATLFYRPPHFDSAP